MKKNNKLIINYKILNELQIFIFLIYYIKITN